MEHISIQVKLWLTAKIFVQTPWLLIFLAHFHSKSDSRAEKITRAKIYKSIYLEMGMAKEHKMSKSNWSYKNNKK